MTYTYSDIAKTIDHSLLPPVLTTAELEAGCLLARRYQVASVCILPYSLSHCAEHLRGSGVEPSTTIGFPHGGHTTAIKLAETEQALGDGGTELDMVINISRARSGDWKYVGEEIRLLTEATHAGRAKIKVIFEKRLSRRQLENSPVRNLWRHRRVLGKDLDRLCTQWRHSRRCATDA